MKIIEKIFLILLLATASLAVADEDESNINNEAKIRTSIAVEQTPATNACKAELEIEYYQKGSSAHVESTLTNEDCGASFVRVGTRVRSFIIVGLVASGGMIQSAILVENPSVCLRSGEPVLEFHDENH